jgi:hypothetical protein
MSEEKKPLTERDRRLRRRVWLSVYLPMILGGLVVVGLVVVLAILGFREENLAAVDNPASVAGDVAAILVIAQALIILLFPLAIAAGLAYLSIRLVGGVHPLLKRGQDLSAKVALQVNKVMDKVINALIRVYSQGARWQTIKRYLRRSNV